jgi:hypothetical protein
MQSNVIAFDRNRKPANRVIAAATARDADASRGKVVSIADWKTRVRARRTASGVFFSTGVLLTYGNAA